MVADQAVHVQRGKGGSALQNAALYLPAYPGADEEHADQQDQKAGQQELACEAEASEVKHRMTTPWFSQYITAHP